MKYISLIICLILSGHVFATPAGIIEFPERTDVTLDNGLRVILIEHHEQPTVSFRFLINAGVIDNPLKKEGLAEITGELLWSGTSSRTQDEIVNTTALIGTEINIATRSHYTSLNMDVLRRYSDIGFDIFTDIILDPIFPSKELKRIKKEYVNRVKVDLTSNNKIAYSHGDFTLFGDQHPLGRVKTEKSLKGINGKDVRAFYQSFYRPNNSILLAIGDFSTQEMLDNIKTKYSQWQKAPVPERIQTKVDFSKPGIIRLVDKPKMTQAVIHLKQWSPDSQDDDYYAYQLMNYILGGGGFSSRLMEGVRAKGGKTYSIRSRYIGNLDFGHLSITTATRSDQLLNTYRLIQDEFQKLSDEGVTQEELSRAVSYITGSIPLQLESPGMIANKILRAIVKGFTIDELSREIVNYKRVQVADVNGVIKKYLNPENMNLVIVGDAKQIKDQVEKIGPYSEVNYKSPLVKAPFLFIF